MSLSSVRVAVTGYGILSCLGENIIDFSRRMFAGESGIRELKGLALPEDFPVTIAGVIDQMTLSGEISRTWNKYCETVLQMELETARQAISSSGNKKFDSIVYCGLQAFHFESVLGLLKSPQLLNQTNFGLGSTADYYCGKIADQLELTGQGRIPRENRICVNTACTSGTHGIGLAFENIKYGLWKRCLVIASDWRPLESGLMNFLLLKALSTSKESAHMISRPFDRTRSGVVRAQGAGAIVLEAIQKHEKSNDRTLAEVTGFGFTSDAFRLTDGREDVLCLKKAITNAITSAEISIDEIDYVNAHGTSTRLNDRLESKAIREIFGDRSLAIPTSSLKSQMGHSISAAGMIEAIACVLMLQHQMIAPTINYYHPDPDCDLDYVPNVARTAQLNNILKNSMAFGGQNACLIFRKAGL